MSERPEPDLKLEKRLIALATPFSLGIFVFIADAGGLSSHQGGLYLNRGKSLHAERNECHEQALQGIHPGNNPP